MFVLAVVVIGLAGTVLAAVADRLADKTGLGEAVFGAVFLGATTSLSGSVMSVASAAEGHPQLAIGNAIGGIGVQTTFLAVADLTYHRANLEHAAASASNLMQAALLVVLLSLVLLTVSGPEISLWSVNIATPFVVIAYLFGIRLVSQSSHYPMWSPRSTQDTVMDQPDTTPQASKGTGRLWVQFAILAVLVSACGWILSRAGVSIAAHTGLDETIVGTLFTAVSTSIPELVTAVAAVRRGALTLAVGDIIGGNIFDVLMFPMSDLAYREGSVYHAVSSVQTFWVALSILLTGILLMGLLRRERYGVANIGLESVLVVALYVGAVALLLFQG